MKKTILIAALGLFSLNIMAQDAKPEEGFVFTTVKENPITSIKNQNRSSTCWSFSTLGFIESELLRLGKGEYDLSEMFVVHKTMQDRGVNYVRYHGDSSFSPGGSFYDVMYCIKNYGIVPQEVMPGIMYGDTLPVHNELDAVASGYINAIAKGKLSKLTPVWKNGLSAIYDTYLGACPENFTYNGKEYVFIDTAGLIRKNKIKEELERYSIIRTVTAVERADVVLVVIDATEGVTEQDAKIAGIAHERGKGIIVVVNKWDAIEKNDKTIYEHTNRIKDILSFMPYAEILFISAKTGQRVGKIFDTIDMVIENQNLRIQTGVLNEILSEAVAMQQPPSDKGKRLKIFYMTQVSVKPPTFVIFVNNKELMHFSYTRYLENKIRDTFGFRGTALRFIIRERGEKE